MIVYKTKDEIELIRDSSLLVGKTLAEVAKYLLPGVSTLRLDQVAEEYIRDHGAIPGFKDYRGYPATLCISINSEVVHGIPRQEKYINDGDIVSIDCGVIKNGYYGDSAYTFPVGNVDEKIIFFINKTEESLCKGIAMAVAGKRLGDIGYAVQSYVESYGYSVVRDLVGHGIGKNLHEDPNVLNYGKQGSGTKLQPGLVICIEPMINMGRTKVVHDNDGWTVRTADNMPSAHYEHTVAVRNGSPDVLTTFDYIKEELNKKK
jgi:methionyl aminopeptidase